MRVGDRVIWVPNAGGLFANTSVGFCPNEKAWDREMKKMNVKGEVYPKSAGHCVALDATDHHGHTIIICLNESLDQKDFTEPLSVLVHESVHVKQFLMGYIGEDEPSVEFEAYTTQYFFQHLLEAYRKCLPKKQD